MTETSFDLIIIGGGPGGYVAAIRASQLGLNTALVEKTHLGGICLNWGCIPTKTLLRSSEMAHLLKNAEAFGFEISGVTYNIDKMVERSRKVAAQLSQGIAHLLKKNKVTVFEGEASLKGQGKVAVQDTILEAPHIILATGARARTLPGMQPDGKLVWTYKEAMIPDRLPKSLLIVGSGAIGMEFASFYNDLGVDVTIVEILDRILPVEDEEISALARKQFTAQGLKILTGAKVSGLKKGDDSVTVSIETGGQSEDHVVDRVIVAAGIVGNTEIAGLEQTAVNVDKSHVIVNEWLETGEPGLYAIGDLVGPPWLAHKASHEAVICVEKIVGLPNVHPLVTNNIPACTYSRPQIASVGLTEQQAKEQGYEARIGRFPFVGNGKAIALGETEGLVKTIFDSETGELLGAHMIGADVTELIQGYSIAKTLETTEAELIHTIFPHPTLSEMMHESVLDAYGQAIHV